MFNFLNRSKFVLKNFIFFSAVLGFAFTLTGTADQSALAYDKRGPGPGGNVSYLDGHNHLHGHYGPGFGRGSQDWEGAAGVALVSSLSSLPSGCFRKLWI